MSIAATDAERAAGQSYDALFVPSLFERWTRHILDAADIARGDRTLDIACGTGVLTRAAAERAGTRVTGLDPAPGMLATAEDRAPHLAWVQASAEALPFPDTSFDLVLSQFGMMFFADREKAVREIHRVLEPGGRLAIAVWDRLDANPVYQAIGDLFAREISQSAADALALPFCLGDPRDLKVPFADAGLHDVQVAGRTEEANFPSLRSLIEAELRGWLPLFDIHLDEAHIARVLRAAEQALAHVADPSGRARFATSAHILTARKPL